MFNRPCFLASELLCRINNDDRDSLRVILNEDATALRRIVAVSIWALAAPEYKCLLAVVIHSPARTHHDSRLPERSIRVFLIHSTFRRTICQVAT